MKLTVLEPLFTSLLSNLFRPSSVYGVPGIWETIYHTHTHTHIYRQHADF